MLVIRIVMEISVCSLQFQIVTICHGFITFLFQSLLQLSPISCGIYTIRQHSRHVNYWEVPLFFLIVSYGANFSVFKQFWYLMFRHILFVYYAINISFIQSPAPCRRRDLPHCVCHISCSLPEGPLQTIWSSRPYGLWAFFAQGLTGASSWRSCAKKAQRCALSFK